jgi:hypothetical protein
MNPPSDTFGVAPVHVAAHAAHDESTDTPCPELGGSARET